MPGSLRHDARGLGCGRFAIETFSHGYFVEITRLVDGNSVFVQGDDAVRLVDELDRATGIVTSDDIVSNYFD